jgi:hypothetical protein
VDSHGVITASKNVSGKITISFPYDPQLVQKVKTIDGRKWHPDEKYWSFPDSNSTSEKILEIFEGEKIHLDPALKGTVPDLRTEQNGVVESGLSLQYKHD